MRAFPIALVLQGCAFVSKDRYEGDLERIFGETGETGGGETGETGDGGDCEDPVARDALALQEHDVIEDAAGSWRGGFGYVYVGLAGAPLGDLDQDGRPDFGLGSAGSALVVFEPPASADMQVVYDAEGEFLLDDRAVLAGMLEYLHMTPQPAGDLDGDGVPDLILAATGAPLEDNLPGVYLLPGPIPREGELYALRALSSGDARLITDSLYDSWVAVGPGDLDGDGEDDLALTASTHAGGMVGVAWGGGAITGTCTEVTGCVDLQIEAEDPSLLGWVTVAPAGDADGDGQADLVVGAALRPGLSGASTEGAAWVLSGADLSGESLALLTDEQAQILGWNTSSGGEVGGVGAAVAGLGDMDGDGLDDVIVGAPSGNEPQATLLLGDEKQIKLERPAEGEPGHDRFSDSVAAGGDVNGDCLADAVVVAPPHFDPDDEGAVFVLLGDTDLGGRTRIEASEAARMVVPLVGDLSAELSAGSVGDPNQDGYDDLFVGSSAWAAGEDLEEGGAWLHLGGAAP